MSLGRQVPAGVLDSGLASLATFLVGIAAVRTLQPDVLGAYALFFQAFILASIVPQRLVFQPAEVHALPFPGAARLGVLNPSLRAGWVVVAAAAACTAGTLLVIPDEVPAPAALALAVTCGVLCLVSSAQDHVRRFLHLAGASWAAVVVSLLQLVGVVVAIGVAAVLDLPGVWIPLGSLAAANLVSVVAGLWLAARHARGTVPVPALRLATLTRTGRWLLPVGLLPSAASFVVAAVVTAVAGAAAMGAVETARIAAQPLLVLITGLMATIGPRSMTAGRVRDRAAARRAGRLFGTLVVLSAAVYLPVVLAPPGLNPFTLVLPAAAAVPGLVTLSVLSHVLLGLAASPRAELIGAGQERALLRIEMLAAGVQTGFAATTPVIGPLAWPAASAAGQLVALLGASRRVGRTVGRVAARPGVERLAEAARPDVIP